MSWVDILFLISNFSYYWAFYCSAGEIARVQFAGWGTYNIYFSIVHARAAWRFFDVERACSSTVDSSVCPKVLTSLCRGACCTALRTSPKVCCLHRNSCPPRRSRRPICTPPSPSWDLLAQKRDRQISPPIWWRTFMQIMPRCSWISLVIFLHNNVPVFFKPLHVWITAHNKQNFKSTKNIFQIGVMTA